MTTVPLFAAHTGRHRPRQERPPFFRRIVAAVRRKPAVPEIPSPASGAAAHFTLSAAMDTGEFPALDAKVDAVIRPVNGQYRGTQPRLTPVPFSELNSKFDSDRPKPDLLRQVLDGLRKLDVTA